LHTKVWTVNLTNSIRVTQLGNLTSNFPGKIQ
jgi:hypothetical protein